MRVKVTRQTRRGKRRWIVDWHDLDGARHQPTFSTKEGAEAEAERIRADLRGRHGRSTELPLGLSWSELFARTMANRHDLKPRTRASYEQVNRLYLAPAFGATPVRALDRARCKVVLRDLLDRVSANTVRLAHATLHVVLGEAVEDGLIGANPVAGLGRKLKLTPKQRARQEAIRVKAMTRQERDTFLATAERLEPRWAAVWTLQALTGLRGGEVLALEPADLDLDCRTLRVARTLAEDGQLGTPKSGVGRTVDLSNEAIRVLRAQLHLRRTESLRRGWRDPRPLFPSPMGVYTDPTKMRAAFRRICTAAGLVTEAGIPKFTPHSLRHTFASLHLQLGTDVYYVSRTLGHADISLTVGTYGAWLQPTRRAAVDALDRGSEETSTEARA